jgi:hypothetical protein
MLKIAVIRDDVLCGLVDVSPHFGGHYCPIIRVMTRLQYLSTLLIAVSQKTNIFIFVSERT